MFGWLEATVQATPLPPLKPTTTFCVLVTSEPDVPKFSTWRFKVSVPGFATPVWETATACPATVNVPLRVCDPLVAVIVQGAALPEIDIEAQLTLDEAEVGGQSPGTGVIVIPPEAPADTAEMLLVLNP
jgi:hypothetical protein